MSDWVVGDRCRTGMGLTWQHELQAGTVVAVRPATIVLDPSTEQPVDWPDDGRQNVEVRLDIGDLLDLAGANLFPERGRAVARGPLGTPATRRPRRGSPSTWRPRPTR